MTGVIDWAASRARMVMAFVLLSLVVGTIAYVSLPKEGEPDIDIPGLFVSVPFPGISAADSERLLVRPMETELQDLDGLTTLTGTAAENYAGVFLEFEFGWDKSATIADVRAAMNEAEANFPDGAEAYTINEINFSEFPILIVALSGDAPEREMLRLADALQTRLEGLEPVLEAGIAGSRDEMLEVVIDPLALEAYDLTAQELIDAVTLNNQLIAAGDVTFEDGSFGVRIPSSFDSRQDVYGLVVRNNGDSVVTLGDLADIRLTYEDRVGTARFEGETTVALQVVKRRGFNIIDTAALVRETVDAFTADWPEGLQASVEVNSSLDQSDTVASMVRQLEGSVLTAIALVMVVVLAALGTRSALLVGFAIPTSFLLCFIFLGIMGVAVSNIVMFGLILAVGMLVDGAIVVVEYADKRLSRGERPMVAYVQAAKRMFWPIVASTATTLCAFLPFLFWPGVPGEFMGMLPVTMIFVLSASLLVALIYLPVIGGVAARFSRVLDRATEALRRLLPVWPLRAVLAAGAAFAVFCAMLTSVRPGTFIPVPPGASPFVAVLPGLVAFLLAAILLSVVMGSIRVRRPARRVEAGYRRSAFGWLVHLIVGNPVMPVVMVILVGLFVAGTFAFYAQNNNGTEFFVDSEPEQAIAYVSARGNLSIEEQDRLVRQVEEIVLDTEGVADVFAFAGEGGLDTAGPGASGPNDAIGQVQIDLIAWEDRPTSSRPAAGIWGDLGLEITRVDPAYDGNTILDGLQDRLDRLPGIEVEISELAQGPAQGKPLNLRLTGDNWDDLRSAAATARAHFDAMPGLILQEDTRPLPGIDWQIDVDVEAAGRYGANVATVGAMVQLVTRGVLLDTMRVPSSDEEIEIRVRFPEDQRVLSTLETLRVRTPDGLVPLANFVTWTPTPQLAQIDRVDQERYFEVRADVTSDLVSLSALPEAAEDGAVAETAEVLSGAPTEQAATELALARSVSADRVADGYSPDLSRTTARGFPLNLFVPDIVEHYDVVQLGSAGSVAEIQSALDDPATAVTATPVTANERIARITDWLEAETPLPDSVSWTWAGDQEDQAESQAFLGQAFGAALGLMFIILLAQFNSIYNSVLVLLAVVLSTVGVLIGMLVMDQTFSIIMTGTGIVALAGIVVNNNIVLIDTYQDYARYMPRLEAITRTAEARIRPVLMTTITTMAGLAPMMFGLSLDFFNGGYAIDSPTALWWKQLATAVVFGLGVATVLTLIFTPSLLALRVWAWTILAALARGLGRLGARRVSRRAQDWALRRQARRAVNPVIFWDEQPAVALPHSAIPAEVEAARADEVSDGPAEEPELPLRAAE